jgi:hypothetical protein
VEDIFFILEKVLTRSLSLYLPTTELQIQSASLPFSVCGQIIEHLDPPLSDRCDSSTNGSWGGGVEEELCLFSLLTNKDLYLSVATHIPFPHSSSSSHHTSSAVRAPGESAGGREATGRETRSGEEDEDPDLEVSDVVEYASAIGADLAVGTLAFAGAAGGWLASFAGPAVAVIPSPPSSSSAPTSPTKTPNQISLPTSPPHSNSNTSTSNSVMMTAVAGSSLSSTEELFLSHKDAAIYINSVTIAVLSIANLSLLLQDFLPTETDADGCRDHITLPSNPLLLSVTVIFPHLFLCSFSLSS